MGHIPDLYNHNMSHKITMEINEDTLPKIGTPEEIPWHGLCSLLHRSNPAPAKKIETDAKYWSWLSQWMLVVFFKPCHAAPINTVHFMQPLVAMIANVFCAEVWAHIVLSWGLVIHLSKWWGSVTVCNLISVKYWKVAAFTPPCH